MGAPRYAGAGDTAPLTAAQALALPTPCPVVLLAVTSGQGARTAPRERRPIRARLTATARINGQVVLYLDFEEARGRLRRVYCLPASPGAIRFQFSGLFGWWEVHSS